MAYTFSKTDGFLTATEAVTLAANATGGTVDVDSSHLNVTGKGKFFAKADEDSTDVIIKGFYYTEDELGVSVSHAQDPSAATSIVSAADMTWVLAKVSDTGAAEGNAADDTLESYIIPKNAKYVKCTFTVANGYGGGSETVVFMVDGVESTTGFSIDGIGAAPS